MHNQYVKDILGNVYIGLNNHDRKYCWYISALQRLHSSKSLNEQFTNKPKLIYLEPLYYYSLLNNIAILNQDNLKKYYNLISESLEKCINTFSDVVNNGGIPDHMLVGFMLPIIYMEYNNINLIENIIKDLNINPTRFNKLLYSSQCKYMFRATKNNRLNNDIEQAYISISNELNNKIINIDNNFLITTIHVYFNNFNNKNEELYPGHAINLVYGYTDIDQNNPKLYIIDDSTTIMPLDLYLNYHTREIGYCDVMDVNDIIIDELRKKDIKINMRMHRCVLDLTERENTDIKNIINNSTVISGGNQDDIIFNQDANNHSENNKEINYEKIYNKPNYNFINYKLVIIIIIIFIIVVVIFIIINFRKHSETYKPTSIKNSELDIINPSYNVIKNQISLSSNYDINPETLSKLEKNIN